MVAFVAGVVPRREPNIETDADDVAQKISDKCCENEHSCATEKDTFAMGGEVKNEGKNDDENRGGAEIALDEQEEQSEACE